ncbi:hypothetical protein ACKFKG_29585 [Phormidesmis sp. 146-35]
MNPLSLYYAGMEPSQDPDRLSPSNLESDLEFEQSLQSVERSLQELKDRHLQIQRDQKLQAALQTQRPLVGNSKRSQLDQGKSPELQVELRKIEQQLEELEVSLESRLFSWAGFKEVFWQAVRFCGLGILVGWSLAFYTLKNPTPSHAPPPTPPVAP